MENKCLPAHIAIIMDGNGRWAKSRGMMRVQGHSAGMETLREIVRYCGSHGISFLTVYAFSTENWKRSSEEVGGIFKLLVKYVHSEINELNNNNVKVNIIGDWSVIPSESRDAVKFALDTTKNNTGLVFNIALNYGGRDDIVHAVRSLALSGEDMTRISEEDISSRLYTANMPDPDLIIRTGGEYRLSNFLIWQSAYSEIMVTDVMWPDFTPSKLEKCIEDYGKRDRRYGGITEA